MWQLHQCKFRLTTHTSVVSYGFVQVMQSDQCIDVDASLQQQPGSCIPLCCTRTALCCPELALHSPAGLPHVLQGNTVPIFGAHSSKLNILSSPKKHFEICKVGLKVKY